MATRDRITIAQETIAQEVLVERIEDILDADLNFLFKLSPKELGILAISLEKLIVCPGDHISVYPYFSQ